MENPEGIDLLRASRKGSVAGIAPVLVCGRRRLWICVAGHMVGLTRYNAIPANWRTPTSDYLE